MNTQEYIAKRFTWSLYKDGMVRIANAGRNDLARVWAELGFKVGVEIGTERGKYAEVILKSNPGVNLTCIDPYLLYEDGEGYKDNISQENHNDNFKIAHDRLSNYSGVQIKVSFSEQAVKKFADNSLDFVYIDGNHRLDYVVRDLVLWTPKVKKGGIVAGHDYIRLKGQHYSHVPYALDAYRYSYFIPTVYVMDNKKPTNSKEENQKLDRIRSWFFVK